MAALPGSIGKCRSLHFRDFGLYRRAMTQAPKIGLVSLGCPKALVDSERIMTTLRAQGYAFSRDYAGADIVLVNTCGFLDSAKQESLEAIGEALAENGKVIVTGCLGVEEDLIRQTHPSVLNISGPHQYEAVVNAVNQHLPPVPNKLVDLVPEAGLRLTPKHYAYLKISEGCNNRCSFCIIPQIRGDLASRPMASVLYEAERLVKSGVKEIMVISQDTSAYGLDIKYAPSKFHGRDVTAKFHTLAEEMASSMCGHASTTSIPTRTSTASFRSWRRARSSPTSTSRSSTLRRPC